MDSKSKAKFIFNPIIKLIILAKCKLVIIQVIVLNLHVFKIETVSIQFFIKIISYINILN